MQRVIDMKKVLADAGFGLLVSIVLAVCQILVAFLFEDPFSSNVAPEATTNYEMLICAVLAIPVSMMFAWLSRTKSSADALRKSVVWTLMLAFVNLVMGIIDMSDFNGTFTFAFGSLRFWGFYPLLAGVFSGPLLYARFKYSVKPAD